MKRDNIPIIIDTDAGSDDFMAIAFLLHQYDLNIEAITIVHGVSHIGPAVRNIRILLQSVGKMMIPVYAGTRISLLNHRSFPEDWKNTAGNIGQYFDNNQTEDNQDDNDFGDGDAVEFLTKRMIMTHDNNNNNNNNRPFKLLALGPLTNIALAFRSALLLKQSSQSSSAIIDNAAVHVMTVVDELVIMGGAFACRGNVHADVSSNGDDKAIHGHNEFAEWNIFADPEAAQEVINSIQQQRIGIISRVVLIGLDATNHVPFCESDVVAWQSSTTATGTLTSSGYTGHAIRRILESNLNYIRHGTFFAWDPLAAVYLVEPAVVTLQHASQGVEVMLTKPEIGRTKYCSGSCSSVNAMTTTITDAGNTDSSSSSSSIVTATAAGSKVLSNNSSSSNIVGSINSEVADSISNNVNNCSSNHYPSVNNNIYVAVDADAEKFFQVFYKAFHVTSTHSHARL